MKKQFRDFESAREFARALNLKGFKEWREYVKSGNKPDDIPSNPNGTYKNEWKGWGEYLGTDHAAPLRDFCSFKEAREFVIKLGLKNQKEWFQFCKSGNKPDNIPRTISIFYKNKGWTTWGDFLGTGIISVKYKKFLPYAYAKKFVSELNLKNYTEWRTYSKSGDKPEDIPASPRNIYLNDGWTTWGDYLGTGTIRSRDKVYRPFKEAREFVRALGLKNRKEWEEYCKSGDKPDDIPNVPDKVYTEWNIKRRENKK
jgi:hypothetical protein